MRPYRAFRTASREQWKKFKIEYPEHKKMSFKTFKSILYKEAELIAMFLFESGEMMALSHGIGDVCINRKKMKGYIDENGNLQPSHHAIDWKATREEGCYVFHKNYNSNGYYYKWSWFPDTSRVKFPHLWAFDFNREWTTMLGKMLNSKDNRQQFMYKEWY
jgi:hypothetical protein